MTCRLQVAVAAPDRKLREYPLPADRSFCIGRDSGCDLVLDSPAVSRIHVSIEPRGRELHVVDTSANGTLVGSQVVKHAEALTPTPVVLRLGPYALTIGPIVRSLSNPETAPAEVRRKVHRMLFEQLDLAAIDSIESGQEELQVQVVAALERAVCAMEEELPPFFDRRQFVNEMLDEVLGLGPIQALLDDDDVSEVMVVDPETIYVERSGRVRKTSLRFTDDESCRSVIERIITPLGRRIDESTPLVDARLDDGSRVNAIIPPLAVRGPCITIRKFPRLALEMPDLVASESLSKTMAEFLERCVCMRKNIVVSGGTGSGKTTLLNVLSKSISAEERIVTIEDAAELRLQQPHVVALEAKPPNREGRGAYTIRDLVKNALRMRPDRIIVGECRAGEAIDMLQAMNTGHEGSMTSTHANSPREAISRLQTLCMMAGLDLSAFAIRQQIASSVHLIVHQTRFPDGTRRVTSIVEVAGLDEQGELRLRPVFEYCPLRGDSRGRVVGEFRPTGYVPSFVGQFVLGDFGDEGGSP